MCALKINAQSAETQAFTLLCFTLGINKKKLSMDMMDLSVKQLRCICELFFSIDSLRQILFTVLSGVFRVCCIFVLLVFNVHILCFYFGF